MLSRLLIQTCRCYEVLIFYFHKVSSHHHHHHHHHHHSLRNRRLEEMGARKNGAREGDMRGDRERLPERSMKIVSRRQSNYPVVAARSV